MSYSVLSSRNEKVWDDYLSELALNPSLSLARFLRTRHVGVHSYENWMSRKGYSAREAKARAANLQPEPLRRESMAPEESFVPEDICSRKITRQRDAPGSPVFHVYWKYFTPDANTFISCSPKIFTATPLPRRSMCAILPRILPSGLVMPSMEA